MTDAKHTARAIAHRLGVQIDRTQSAVRAEITVTAPDGKRFSDGGKVKVYRGWSVESVQEAWQEVVEDLTEGLKDEN